MSRCRFFTNTLQDFVPGTKVAIDPSCWVPRIKAIADTIVKQMPPTFENCDGNLYVGCAGVAYMFEYLAGFEHFLDLKVEYLTRARNYIDVSLSYCKSKSCRDPPAAFLLGPAGVYAAASLIYADINQMDVAKEFNKKYLSLGSACGPVDYLGCGSDELLVGRAGYLCGAFALNRKFGEV